jgi:hypothetical protein
MATTEWRARLQFASHLEVKKAWIYNLLEDNITRLTLEKEAEDTITPIDDQAGYSRVIDQPRTHVREARRSFDDSLLARHILFYAN